MGDFLFYQLDDEVTTVEIGEINSNLVTTGYFNRNECETIGVDDNEPKYGCSADVLDRETIINLRNDFASVKMIIRKNLFIVVDYSSNQFVRDSFFQMLSKCSPVNASASRLICSFFDLIIAKSNRALDKIEGNISSLEELVLNDGAGDSFNHRLLKMKKKLLKLLGFYRELLSICDLLCDNENEVITEDLICLDNLKSRVQRVKEDIISLQNSVVHLQDAYSSFLDLKLNRTMKIFTVITSVFFPLTVITSWYGMNFKYMPELSSRFGYPVVILLSIIIVCSLVLVGKKRKWF